ncbi:MAG: DUF2142 domain-containing protein [Chloroflexia bacterium]|nr:DUF2142 domain-containing protein [Chloroflexia bacterium]
MGNRLVLRITLLNRFQRILNRISPHAFFSFTAGFYGLLMILVTPPFQVADEFNHFYRSYQISTGQFLPLSENNRLIAEVPKSFCNFQALSPDYPGIRNQKQVMMY